MQNYGNGKVKLFLRMKRTGWRIVVQFAVIVTPTRVLVENGFNVKNVKNVKDLILLLSSFQFTLRIIF